MAPSKKREKDQQLMVMVVATSANTPAHNNTANSNINGCVHSTATTLVSTAAAAAATGGTSHAMAEITAATTPEGLKLNGHQQEQELFLQAFEKPTQIYRYLRNRHETNPIFLNRTLSYMKDRMSRNNKKRANFNVNSIMDVVTQKTEVVTQNYLHIIFDALYEKQDTTNTDTSWQAGEMVCVESMLYKITRSKRKDSTLDFQEIFSKSSKVVYNPKDNVTEYMNITLPVQSMRPMGEQHTLYKLLFRIKMQQQQSDSENAENEDSPKKRARTSDKVYGCELILYEKSSGFICEGEYEAMLQPLNTSSVKSYSPKKCTWEAMPDNYIPAAMTYDAYQQRPTLKFHLTLSNEELPAVISACELHLYAPHINAAMELSHTDDVNYNNNCIKPNTNGVLINGSSGSASRKSSDHIQLVYNFMYSNNTRQQTEYTRELNCPWCGLNCLRLYALLKHLKLCHARFNFTYTPVGNCARIDVTINDAYDGSYSGSPYDLAGPSGSSFARTCGPVRRTTVTSLLVCRPRRQKTCLDEFYELEDDEISNNRSYVTGHNRLYHHTETCLPVHPKELDIDSEGESDPLWLRQKTIQMIDEFSDVNEGEKELMKLWNLHVMKHGFVGDCQLPLACEMFLEAKGHEIIRKNLYRNFILHMSSLFDYGLISPETVYKTVQKLQGMLSKYAAGQEMMSRQRETQLRYWLEVGIHKQDEQKLKSPQKPNKKLTGIDIDTGGSSSASSPTSSRATTSMGAETKSMQPPKRMPQALKRASAAALAAANSSKNVARKSAEQLNAAAPTRDRRTTENGLKRSASTSTADTRSSLKLGLKRRLPSKEKHTTPPPSTKRQRTDNLNFNNNNTANGMNSATRNANNRNPTLPTANSSKRLLAGRHSNEGVGAATSGGGGQRNISSSNSNGVKSTQRLRTRLSLPLAKKDRR